MESTKLSIKINNNKPLELNELTNSLNALAKEYDSYCKNKFGYTKTDRRLEILNLEHGSLSIELAPIIIPALQEINVILSFGEYLINILDYFTGKVETLQPDCSKRTCDNISAFVNPTANDNGSNIAINILGNGNTILVGREYDSVSCNALQNNCTKHKERLLEEEPYIKHKQPFYWVTASFAQTFTNLGNDTSDKGVIEPIDKKPHKIIFENDTDKQLITRSNEKYKKEWQELLYIVDVEIIRIQDIIKIYKILKVHYEDTIDPEKED